MATRTRIAPSPTGDDIHIGNLYTALINWVVARQNGGQFIIRIEDTDQTRLVAGAEQRIITSLNAYGLSPDEAPRIPSSGDGDARTEAVSLIKKQVMNVELEADPGEGPYAPYRQSERLPLYKQKAFELVKAGKAYVSLASKEQLEEFRVQAKEAGKQAKERGEDFSIAERSELKRLLRQETVVSYEPHVPEGEYTVRLLVPDHQEITFTDRIRGTISFNTDQVDDQVLLKSDGFPTYHLAVVVDDVAMGITHIIRGEEWINSTPKHVLLYDAFGWDKPVFAHMPILRNPDKSKLSKRKNPVWGGWFLEQGFLPEAILNYLALMGWSHPEEKELFTLDEFIAVFKLEDVAPVGPVFDIKKLEWMNGMYIREMSRDLLTDRLMQYFEASPDLSFTREFVYQTVPLIQERIKLLSEYEPYVRFLRKRPDEYDIELTGNTDTLSHIATRLEVISDWKAEIIGEAMLTCAADLGIKNSAFFQMLRVAITGRKVSPPLNESMEILGKDECVQRVRLSME